MINDFVVKTRPEHFSLEGNLMTNSITFVVFMNTRCTLSATWYLRYWTEVYPN